MIFSVIISTYNRKHLLERCIKSIISQGSQFLCEIIIIDDASNDGTAEYIKKRFPEVCVFCHETNKGPGSARNYGIQQAKGEWAIIMDDDDTLSPGAFEVIIESIQEVENEEYVVLNFATSNSTMEKDYMIIRPVDYFKGTIKGDFLPVINIKRFKGMGYAYPELRIGGESLLWLEVAEQNGIPTWNKRILHTHTDAPTRLTNFTNQLSRARDFAEYQDMLIEKFNMIMKRDYPNELQKRLLGSAVYWGLAGNKKKAWKRLGEINRPFYKIILSFLLIFPNFISRRLFLLYRYLSSMVG